MPHYHRLLALGLHRSRQGAWAYLVDADGHAVDVKVTSSRLNAVVVTQQDVYVTQWDEPQCPLRDKIALPTVYSRLSRAGAVWLPARHPARDL